MAATTTGSSKTPLKALTGLRFIAALAVVLYHYRFLIAYPSFLRPLIEEGKAGVGLFFVLSGFILVYTYLDWFQADCARFWAFIRARFARVYPMHLVMLLVVTPVVLVGLTRLPHFAPDRPGVVAGTWLANLLLLQAYLPIPAFHLWNGPSWSISDEAFFYALFPFFVRFVLARCRSVGRTALLVVGLFVVELVVFAGASRLLLALPAAHGEGSVRFIDLWYWSPFLRVWEFLLGAACGLLFLQARAATGGIGAALRRAPVRNAALAAALVAVPALALLIRSTGTPLNVYVAYTAPFALLILTLAAGPTLLSPLLEHRWMLLLGEASYSLYLIHYVVVMVLEERALGGNRPGLPLLVAAIVLTVLASIACYKLIEMPARRALRGSAPRPALGRLVRQPTQPSADGS